MMSTLRSRAGLSVAEAIAEEIRATGVRFAFGVPGGEVVFLIDALARRGVPFVLTHHETTAAFMAGAYGEITGQPGICVATLGPGATNMLTGVASAMLERAPLIALTGALATSAPRGATHQAIDLNAVYGPVTKVSIAVSAENAVDSVATAIRISRTPRPGPAHLAIPADVAASRAQQRREHRKIPEHPREPGTLQLRAARKILASANRPALVVGTGAVHADASSSVQALARTLQAPVVTLPKAKGIFPEDDPLFAGTLEMAGDDLVVEFLSKADALVLVGLDVVEFDKPWRLSAPTIHVDELPNPGEFYPSDADLVGNIPHTLEALALGARTSAWTYDEVREHLLGLRHDIRPDGKGLSPTDVVDAVRAALPQQTIATSDVGAHKMVVGQAWTALEPRTFFVANGLSSMGYALPVAAVASLLHRHRPVVAFVGDGGLAMYLGELETLVRMQADLLIVVFADESLELIRRAQAQRQLPPTGASFANPDFAALGRAFTFTACEVQTVQELQQRLPSLVAERGVRVVAAHINRDLYRL